MIEPHFDIPFIADLALREKQIQQNYRPIIAVHKWFARRPGTLFRGLLLAEFADQPLRETFYRPHQFPGLRIADPFMGGGTPLLEANRLGCDVLGMDINPMAYWIVNREVEHLDLDGYASAADDLRAKLEQQMGELYRTTCLDCGATDAQVKYFLWVKVVDCGECGNNVDLFPGYLVAADSRHPLHVFVCATCGCLNEVASRTNPGACGQCGDRLAVAGIARSGRCQCRNCRAMVCYPQPQHGAPRHRLFAIEYHCCRCAGQHRGRFFKAPGAADLAAYADAEQRLATITVQHVPEDQIPTGDETNRLHRWGYRYYREMFNARQLLGLELSGQLIAKVADDRVANALATNLSDLLRYQNMLCRYDTKALKSLDIFSVHGFPVGLVQCESNLLGIAAPGEKTCIGSGGWRNIIDKFHKAKVYCQYPFEVRHHGRSKEIVSMPGEWIGDSAERLEGEAGRQVDLRCADAATVQLPPASLDAVFTDPPYYGNVQYAELMDFCYVWLRKIGRHHGNQFVAASTRTGGELTANEDMGRGIDHFAAGLAAVFCNMAQALKKGRPLAFTYHHNSLDAYLPVAMAILDAGLTCSASLPCPAEMGASIHISGTGSSIIDTIFVCRSTGTVPRGWIADSAASLARLVDADLAKLRQANVVPSKGDARCIAYGHLIRLAIWSLRHGWDILAANGQKLCRIQSWLAGFATWAEVEACLANNATQAETLPLLEVRMPSPEYGDKHDCISF